MEVQSEDMEWFYTRGIFENSLDEIVLMNTRDSNVFDTLRHSRSGRTLVIIITIITQVVVLALVAMIMGIAVTTMCTLLGEIFVILAIATALERQILTFTDIATILEVFATLMITLLTIFLSSVSSKSKMDQGSIHATKFL